MKSKITISGQIISELSEKIPTNIIALNELLKNSYDAGANNVEVIFDSIGKRLTIKDDGSGMDDDDIDTLFHLSSSTKQYGQINEHGRYTQGSKGLGFLSVFKFGNNVTWRTRKNDGLEFSVNYNDLISAEDLSEYDIPILENDDIEKGTEILIELNNYNASSLKEYFSEIENYRKILQSFDDNDFQIKLIIDGDEYITENNELFKNNCKEYQLYYVKYNSSIGKINFFHNGQKAFSYDFAFNSTRYELDIELIIYKLKPYGKDKIDKLFINPYGDLTPLLYVNANLFNNYDIFDPNIMRNIKNTYVLSQMIGFIRIISGDEQINFNSDRSHFLQNELTDSLQKFLAEINKKIQEQGSIHKLYLIDFDILSVAELPEDISMFTDCESYRQLIKDDFPFKDQVEITCDEENIKFSLFGKEIKLVVSDEEQSTEIDTPEKKKELIPAEIILTDEKVEFLIPTEQIDLRQYIASITDSEGNNVEIDKLKIFRNKIEIADGILPSINKVSEDTIYYNYEDPNTSLVTKTMKLIFSEPISPVIGEKDSKSLISLVTPVSYSVNYNQAVSNLITQINELDINDYKEVIACSLRSIFEISLFELKISSKFSTLLGVNNDTGNNVNQVVSYIRSSNKYLQEIASATGIPYHDLQNLLDINSFSSGISTAHLAAHKSTVHICEPDIEKLAKLAALFAVVVNEMLNNGNIV